MQSINPTKRRVLIIDDNRNIHNDYRKILDSRTPSVESSAALNAFFDEEPFEKDDPMMVPLNIEIDSALQGQQGLEMVKQAVADGRPYSLAFVDIRLSLIHI